MWSCAIQHFVLRDLSSGAPPNKTTTLHSSSSYPQTDKQTSVICTTQERTKDFGEQRENAKKHVKRHNQNVKRLMTGVLIGRASGHA
jgi:hypothetical protein